MKVGLYGLLASTAERTLLHVCSATMLEYLSPATKLREGSVFTPVCDSVHRGDLCPVGRSLPGRLAVW